MLMKRCGWILTASVCLSLPVFAGAQASNPAPAAQPAAAQPAAVQPVSNTTPGIALAAQSTKTPVSIDQVVDQIIEREHALITFLRNRTPLVETYLQNRARYQHARATGAYRDDQGRVTR